ncbi:TetR/AcrR family transcriptional regulator [Aliidiomarina haloalkalitolerans]|uniref:TetR family transcriptional regulator n=1 Tax=Aliidiomarina haloalkalitolerans TaxID=859059 RepID=A0A432VYN7_9GAMM|nr:TetR/AcrR family transcriptional regulator [Aliidiomarina haloalkalitolerans]MCL4409322.1 TetR/AcrR family transcriptional regulator [Gammaproteobacteria bacterium]RUO21779.1 TetR family transcriptional regulator [Aliidiomarina haloalkalitolerans]
MTSNAMESIEKPPKRVHKPAEQRQQEIIAAAVRAFADRGYQVTDMQTIAELAGVGKGTLYRHFPNKEELFKLVLAHQLDILRDRMLQARDSTTNPLCRLYAMMHAYLEYFDTHPDTVELFIQERAEFGREVTPQYFQRMHHSKDDWLFVFQDIKNTYPVREFLSAEEMSSLSGELLHGAVYLSMASVPKRASLTRLDQVFSFYLHGIMHVQNPLSFVEQLRECSKNSISQQTKELENY